MILQRLFNFGPNHFFSSPIQSVFAFPSSLVLSSLLAAAASVFFPVVLTNGIGHPSERENFLWGTKKFPLKAFRKGIFSSKMFRDVLGHLTSVTSIPPSGSAATAEEEGIERK